MSVPDDHAETISPRELGEPAGRGRRADRRAHPGRIPGGPRRARPLGPAGPARPDGRHGGPRRRRGRAAVRDLPFGQPGPAGVREVPRRRLHQRGQRRGRHAGLGAGRPARRAGQEGDLAGAAGADRRRLAGAARRGAGLASCIRPSSPCRRSSGRGWSSPGVTDTCGMGMVLARMPWNRAERGRGRRALADRPAVLFADLARLRRRDAGGLPRASPSARSLGSRWA